MHTGSSWVSYSWLLCSLAPLAMLLDAALVIRSLRQQVERGGTCALTVLGFGPVFLIAGTPQDRQPVSCGHSRKRHTKLCSNMQHARSKEG